MERLSKYNLEKLIETQKRTMSDIPYDNALLMALEEIKEYRQLKEDNRLIELPCKLGDNVWYVDKYCDEKPKVVKGEVDGYLWWRSCGFCLNIIWENPIMGHFAYKRKEMPFTEIGKTVFLTKEDAEKKLKEMESD